MKRGSHLRGSHAQFGGRRSAVAAAVFALAGSLLAQAPESAGAGPGDLTGANAHGITAKARAWIAEVPRPSIVLITTDDQRARDLRFMPKTRRLLVRQGTSFTGLAPHPLCCPARAQLLTGQYAHNNGVRTNQPPWGGYLNLDASQTLPTWLADAGYRTAFFGKYLNGYGIALPPRRETGWSSWHALVDGTYHYRHFVVRHDKSDQHVRDTYVTDYFSDLAVRHIRRLSRSAQPFFLWQSFVAPHAACIGTVPACWRPPPSARRHRDLFADLPLDTRDSPAFNENDVTDKPQEIQQSPMLGRGEIHELVTSNRSRLRALRAVDDSVATMVEALERSEELDNTIIFFTSDNGFLLGEHRLRDKIWGYEPSLRVPFVVRGPGVPANHRHPTVATLLDIPATAVAAAEAAPTLPLDGQDLMPILDGQPGQDTVLITGGPREGEPEEAVAGWFYRGVRTDRYTYVRYDVTREEELYDRWLDPHQVDSVHDAPEYADALAELRRRTAILRDCVGEVCHQPFGAVPGPRQ